MSAFTSYDQIIKSLTNGMGQIYHFEKVSVGNTAVNNAYSLWGVGNIPASGMFGTALTARTITNATTGVIPFNNPSGSNTTYLLGAGMMSSSSPAGVFILVDRLLEAPFNGTTTNAVFNSGSPLVIPSRDANGAPSGAGCFMFVENFDSTTVAGNPTITVIYTNSQGVTGRTTGPQALTASSIQNQIVTSGGVFLPLQSGDTGVQAISGYTLSSSVTSTQLNIVICRPLLYLPILFSNTFIERDMVMNVPSMPQLFSGTALQWLLLSQVAGGSGIIRGYVRMAENN